VKDILPPMRPVLALELSTEGILLHELSYDGKWRKLAAASLNDPFLPKKMAAMRALAKASQGRFFKNELWVPAAQVHSSAGKIEAEDAESRLWAAQQIFDADPNIPAGDYILKLGEEDAEGNTPIAGVDRAIMAEADRFATGYGFGSDGVTSSTPIKGFYKQPYFDAAMKPSVSLDLRKIKFVAIAAIAVAGISAGAWWLYNNIDFSSDPSTAIEATENRIIQAEEDPRAPIRPTDNSIVPTQAAPTAVTPGDALAPTPAFDANTTELVTQIAQLELSSTLDVEPSPESVSAISPITAPQEAPVWANIGRPDSLPAPESNGLPTIASIQPSYQDTPQVSNFEGGRALSPYEAAPIVNSFASLTTDVDALPRDVSTAALPAQLRKLNDSFGLTLAQDNQAAETLAAQNVTLQLLPANVIIGSPAIVPTLRGGRSYADTTPTTLTTPQESTPVVETMTVAQLQRIPTIVNTGFPDVTPLLRNGINVSELPNDPAPTITQPLLSVEDLQNLDAVVSTELPDVTPLLRNGVNVANLPNDPAPTTPDPELSPELTVEELQNLTAVVTNERPDILPILREGVEISDAAPEQVVPEQVPPLDPAAQSERIAALQAAPPQILQGRPRVLPFMRGGLEITGGSGVIADEPEQPAASEASRFRPLFRPASIVEIAVVNDPSISAQAVRNTISPQRRAGDFATKVAAMMAAFERSARETPRFTDAPREISLPTSANVAREATIENGIDLRATSLIGVYGKPGSYKALIRQRGGKYTMVKVGDTLSGWRITAIAESSVRIQKGSRSEVLKLPG